MQTDQAIKEQLKMLAVSRYGDRIFPIGGDTTFDNSYTRFDGKLALWFNTPDDSSHIVTEVDLLNLNPQSQKGFQNAKLSD